MRRTSIHNCDNVSEGNIVFNNGELALARDITHSRSDSILITDAVAILLCLKGQANFQINGTSWEISSGKIVVVPPNVILQGSLYSIDFECVCLSFAIEYIQNLIPLSQRWNFRDSFEASPVLPLTDSEVDTFMQYFNLLCNRVGRVGEEHRKGIIDALVLAFVYEMESFRVGRSRTKEVKVNSADNIFSKFGTLLYSTYPRKRNLSYYAERLNITQKYLSSICKQISGRTAKELIDKAVIDDVEHQLAYTTKSVKEIAFELNFTDATAFGKFVRRHLGMSPLEYRNNSLRT